jgi:hypothetical protein
MFNKYKLQKNPDIKYKRKNEDTGLPANESSN